MNPIKERVASKSDTERLRSALRRMLRKFAYKYGRGPNDYWWLLDPKDGGIEPEEVAKLLRETEPR